MPESRAAWESGTDAGYDAVDDDDDDDGDAGTSGRLSAVSTTCVVSAETSWFRQM